jgi:hypothetical protein
VEKSRFPFLEGSADATAAPVTTAVALPDASAARAGASAACAAPPTDRPVAGASAPATDACPSTASTALGDRGGGTHLSGGARPPSLSSSSFDNDEFSGVAGGESPYYSRSRYSSSVAPGAPAAGSSSSSCVRPTLVPVVVPHTRPLGLGVWVGQTARLRTSPSAKK